MACPDFESPAQTHSLPADSDPARPLHRGRRMLIVDAAPRTMLECRAALEGIIDSHDLAVAESPEDALGLFARGEEFACILVELRLPDLAGLAFAEAVRKRTRFRRTPILFLTDTDAAAVRARAYAVGVVDVLQMPADRELLRARAELFAELAGEQAIMRQRTAELSVIIDTVPALISYVGCDGRYRVANRAYEEVLGIPREQVEGKHVSEIVGDPYYQTTARANFELVLAGETVRFEAVAPGGGQLRHMSVTYSPDRDESGRVRGFVVMAVDITSRKETEARLHAAVLGSPFPLMLHAEDGEVLALSRSWSEISGYAPEEIRTHAEWFDRAYPGRRQEMERRVAQEFASDTTLRAGQMKIVTASGEERVWDFQSVPLGKLADGRRLQMSAAVDVTDRNAAEEAQHAIEKQLMLLVEASATLLASPHSTEVLQTIVGLAQQFVAADAHAVWRRHEGGVWRLSSSEGLSDEYIQTGFISAPPGMQVGPMLVEDVTEERRLASRREALLREGVRSMLVIPLHIDGEAMGTVVFYWKALHRITEPEVRIASALANLAASALATASLYDRELRLRAEAESAERRASFLAEAGAVLASSLDYQATLASVARLAVPSFADWAAVDILTEDGQVQRVAVQHNDPEKIQFAYEFSRRYPPREDDVSRVALRTGTSVLVERISDEMLVERARDAEHLRLIRELGLQSFIVAPMAVNGRIFGLITFVTAESGRHYSAPDLQTAEELARRGAAAIENATLYRDVRSREAQFRTMADSAPVLIWVSDTTKQCTWFNRPWLEFTGRTMEQEYGSGWTEGVHPEDLAHCINTYETAFESRKPFEMTYRLRRHDGEWRWMLDHGVPLTAADGVFSGYIGSVIDITERKQAEERIATLLVREKEARETAELLNGVGPVLAAELDPERLIQSVVDIATRLTGASAGALFYNSTNEEDQPFSLYALSGAAREAFDRLPSVRHTALFLPTFHGKQVVRCDDVLADPRYGRNAPYHGTPAGHLPVRSYLGVPVVSRSGSVLGALLFGHEAVDKFTPQHEQLVSGIAGQAAIALDNARLFAESHRAQEALQRSNDELRRANFDLEQFAYSASHDLKEPLRVVAVYSQMMQRRYRGQLDAAADEYLSYMSQGARRMDLLVRDLLAYTQAVNVTDEAITAVDGNVVVLEALSNLQTAIVESGARVNVGPLPAQLAVKDVHLMQLFQNIIGNAIKYRGESPPVVDISAERDGVMWRICINDNGIGIAPEYAGQVFGIFKRLHTADEYPGTGIGLAICQKIVHRYGGRIWIESAGEGHGSTFCFTLPAGPAGL